MTKFSKLVLGSAAISAILASPFALLIWYEFHQADEARKAYELCSDLNLPLDLEDFRTRFGQPVGRYVSKDETTHSFEPGTGYEDFTSASIEAITKNGSYTVIKFYCGG